MKGVTRVVPPAGFPGDGGVKARNGRSQNGMTGDSGTPESVLAHAGDPRNPHSHNHTSFSFCQGHEQRFLKALNQWGSDKTARSCDLVGKQFSNVYKQP